MNYAFVTGAEAESVAGWVARHIPGCERGFDACTAMMIYEDKPVAGVVFHNYSPESGVIEMSAAALSPRWLTRPVLRAIHRYIFEDCGCQLAVMRVSERNTRMCRIAQKAGYSGYRIPRLRGPDEAEMIFTQSREAWQSGRLSR